MNLFELLYVCIKPSKPVADPVPMQKRESNIDHLNVCITNDRLTEGSLNCSESCNSIMSDLSTIDEDIDEE